MLPVCGRWARGVNGGAAARLRVRDGLRVAVSQPESSSPKRNPRTQERNPRTQDPGYIGPLGERR